MASLFGTAIVAICAGTATGQYNEACNKSIDAGTRQIGIRQTVDTGEDRTIQYVNTTVEQNTSKGVQSVMGAAGFAYKTARDKRVVFKMPTMGLASSVSNEISPDRYAITIKWNF